ncbi:hypothetical protein VTI74DRAFT_1308 [Chaetomium olivicolor]
MLVLEHGLQKPEHLITGAVASGFGARDLDRLGPPYQATQYPSRSISGQGGFAYPPTVLPLTSQPAFQASTAYPALQLDSTSVDAIPVSWQPTTGGLYGSGNSPAVSTGSSASLYSYLSQGNTTSPYVSDYVSPTALQNAPPAGFDVYPGWPGPGDGNVSLGTPNPGTLPSPAMQSYEGLVGTPEGAFSESDPAVYGESDTWQHQQTSSPRRHKRAKKSIAEQSATSSSVTQSLPPPTPKMAAHSTASTTAVGSKTKLRSASRASKNTQYRPEETPQERKSRNSHNLVEKQYRNRLNMQFEILMNALPESMRSPTTTTATSGNKSNNASGGDPDGTDSGTGTGTGTGKVGVGAGGSAAAQHGAFDAGERRLSKAQVLDMSARYIRSLERERDMLEEEREELRESVRRLKERCRDEGEGGMILP